MSVQKSYETAKEIYAGLGVDTDKALEAMKNFVLSIHCWQGDDVGGFENTGAALDGGIAATGNHPGKARTPIELRNDMTKAFEFIPGPKKANIHAMYLESDTKVDPTPSSPSILTAGLIGRKNKK